MNERMNACVHARARPSTDPSTRARDLDVVGDGARATMDARGVDAASARRTSVMDDVLRGMVGRDS